MWREMPRPGLSVPERVEASEGALPMDGSRFRQPCRTHCRFCHHHPGKYIVLERPFLPGCSPKSVDHPGRLWCHRHLHNWKIEGY